MVLDLLSFVKDLARDIYAARHYLKENRETCLKIYEKLRELQNLIARTKPVSDDSELERILSSIEDDLQSVREEFEKMKMRRSRKVRKYLTGAYEAQKLDSMLSTCITCQQRLEVVLCTMARSNQEFSSLVSNVKQCEAIMSKSVHDLVGASAEISKSVGIVHDAVESIPLLVTQGRSSDVLPLSSTAADHSGLLLESSIDVNERKSVESFSQLPSAVCVLMSELARKRLLPENVTKHLECIGKMWEGWRVDINDVEYDEMPNRKPYKIGQGANSIVYAARYKTACQGSAKLSIPIAVKEIDVDDLSSEGGKGDLLREFFLQLSLRSPYIIQTFGICCPGEVFLEPDTADETQYDDVIGGKDRTVRIVMERMACNLRHALRKKILKASEDKIRVLRDICKALLYLHERNIVHRDVKPENILLSMNKNGIVGIAKLADFGCSRFSHDRRLAKTTMSTASSARGTTMYTPPEVIENPEKCRTRKSWDIWSYGHVICDVLSPTKDGKLSMLGVMNHWKKGILIERVQQVAASIEDKTFKALAVKCLSANEKDRPQISEIEKIIDKCDLESAANRKVDEVIPLVKVDESCEQGLKRTELGSGNQSPTQHKLPTGEVKDNSHHKGKDGHRGFHAHMPEDSGQPAQTSAYVGEKAQSGKESERKAVQAYKKAAEKGSTYAKNQLGVCYENGTGVERDVSMAVKLYKEAAEGGSTSAKNNLGFCYMNGIGVERDVSMAVQLFKEAVHGGNTDAKVRLGVCYKNGIGVKRDVSKAAELYKEAAHGGNMFAIYNLGACYQNGAGVERDVSKAVHLYKKAAHGGNIRAKNKLALCYGSGTGVKRDLSKAVRLYKEAADGGSRSAKSNLGFCYATGTGVKRDISKAVELYKESALGGSTDAKVRLGVCHENGTGVKRDVSKAVKLYREAADRGNMFAKYNLAVCYETGTGVERDVSMAVQLYKEAADGGNMRAKNNLGVCYENGTGVERDVSKAVKLYKEAVEGGSTIAKKNLGVCYEEGTGVERDVSKALRLYKEAADSGCLIAKRRWELLITRLA